jgi:hypothetical protein
MTFPTGHEPLLQVATYHLRTRPEALLLLRLLQHPCGRWELQDPKMEVLYHLLYHVKQDNLGRMYPLKSSPCIGLI